jgi:aerobic-type carbon monoxide dehydrogenase small subunit (CoxS/CutS family)
VIRVRVNGAERVLDVSPDTPLLWALREPLGLTGTKFGCGVGICGTCTVHLDGVPVRSCTTSVADAVGREVTTIEGVAGAGGAAVAPRAAVATAVLDAWTGRGVAQCGYCQPGMVMAAVALLAATPSPTDADIDRAFAGHLCRCGSYQRLRAAVHDAARALGASAPDTG